MTSSRKKITFSEVWAFLLDKMHDISKNIATIGILIGALIGVGNWLVSVGTNILDNRMAEVRNDIKEQELSLTRLELMVLINHDPDNKAEIEKVAKRYFIDLNGDQYMSSVYSKWAKEHNAITYFVSH